MLTQPISLAKKSKVRKNNFAISYTFWGWGVGGGGWGRGRSQVKVR